MAEKEITVGEMREYLKKFNEDLVMGYEFKEKQYLVQGLTLKMTGRPLKEGGIQDYVIISHEAFDN